MAKIRHAMWAIKEPTTGEFLCIEHTRAAAIRECSCGPNDWSFWYRRGYRAVRVTVTEEAADER